MQIAIKYSDLEVVIGSEDDRRAVIERETYGLLERYDLHEREKSTGFVDRLAEMLGVESDAMVVLDALPGVSVSWQIVPSSECLQAQHARSGGL